jgi:hypothetical protein
MTNKRGLSHEPIAPSPLNEKREADELRDSLIAHGRTARRLGFGVDMCPPFKDPDMAVWWRVGWRREAG